MPTYEYACTACGHRLEAVQSFSDDPLTTCPECGGSLRKVYGNVGIVFKGSGFYKNDSRSGSSGSNGKSTSSEPATAGGESSTTTSDSPSSTDSSTKKDSTSSDKGKSGSDSKKDSKSKAGATST